MPTEADFLRAMAARPFDDLPRLQYADWLDDCGDARAEWVRSEVAVCPHFRHTEGWGRFAALSATLPPEWLAAAGWYRWPLLVAQIGRPRGNKHLFALREAIPGDKNYASFASGLYTEEIPQAGLWMMFSGGPEPDVLEQVLFSPKNGVGTGAFPGPLPNGLTCDSVWNDVEERFGPPIRATGQRPLEYRNGRGVRTMFHLSSATGKRFSLRQFGVMKRHGTED